MGRGGSGFLVQNGHLAGVVNNNVNGVFFVDIIIFWLSIFDADNQPHGWVPALPRSWGRWDEIILLSWVEFESSWRRREWPESEGEEIGPVGAVAKRHNFVRVFQAAFEKFVSGHVVDHVLFSEGLGHTFVVEGANNVGLLVVPVVFWAGHFNHWADAVEEQGIARVPVHKVNLVPLHPKEVAKNCQK